MPLPYGCKDEPPLGPSTYDVVKALRDLAQSYRNDCETRISVLEEELESIVDSDEEGSTKDVDDQIAHWSVTIDKIDKILAMRCPGETVNANDTDAAWTPQLREAAQREGWDLFINDSGRLTIQCIDDPRIIDGIYGLPTGTTPGCTFVKLISVLRERKKKGEAIATIALELHGKMSTLMGSGVKRGR